MWKTFGDLSAEPYVTCQPDIFKYKISSCDKFIVLACDGLWDVLSNNDVVNFILLKYHSDNEKQNIATDLAKHAIAKGSTDNISIIIVFFD